MAAPNGHETAPENRDALIERLEELGYDTMVGVPVNWRDSMSDIELLAVIKAHSDDDTAAGELPDISEIVEVIRDVSKYAWMVEPTGKGAIAENWRNAIGRLRALLTEIDTALEAFS